MKKSVVWMGVGGVLIAACVMAGWAILRGEAMQPLASPLDVIKVASDTPDAPAVSQRPTAAPDRAGASPAASKPVLPPSDTPFNQAVEALEIAARDGDPVAACRLAAEAWRCVSTQQMESFRISEGRDIAQMVKDSPNASRLETRFDNWAARTQAAEQVLMSCEGVDVSPVRRAHYDVMAAEHGDPVARRRFLGGAHLAPGNTLRNPALLDHYKAHAFKYFMQALEDGDLGILHSWYISTQFSHMQALPAVLPERWRDPALVEAVIAQLSDAQLVELGQQLHLNMLGQDVSPKHQAEAARIHARYFSSAEPPKQRNMYDSLEHCEELSL